LDPRVQRLLRTALDIPVIQVYGTAESGGVITLQSVNDSSVDCVGVPSTTCEVKLRYDDGGRPVGAENKGEVMVKGGNVFTRYLHNHDLTKKVMDRDGWFATGDIGKIGPSGLLTLVDTMTNAKWKELHPMLP
jgi:long-chain acyl-CoA synthetase